MASVSFKYWDDCVNPHDLEAMWADPDVRAEWLNAGETKGSKVHLSRDPDGQPYLTQTEMKVELFRQSLSLTQNMILLFVYSCRVNEFCTQFP